MTDRSDPGRPLTSNYEYDLRGNRTKAIDAGGAETSFEYDLKGRMTRKTDAIGAVTGYEYDDADRVVSMTDANGNVTRFAYDPNGSLSSETRADGATWRYQYDVSDNLESVTDANGTVTRLTYDDADRVIEKNITRASSVLGASRIRMTLDDLGQLTSADTDEGVKEAFQYDSLGRMLSESVQSGTGPARTMSRRYDPGDFLTGLVYPSGLTIDQTFDPLGRIVSNKQGTTPLVTYADFGSRQISRTLTNGIVQTSTWDPNRRLREITASLAAASVSAIRYDRLPSGDKSTILRPDLQKKSSYVYNRNHTILQEHLGIRTASDNDAAEISTVYDVDKVLNYTRVVRNGVEKSAAINSRNQITTLGGASLSWDRNGNLTEYAGKRMQYDSGNQLRRIALPGGAVIENLYGPSGRKVRETVSAQSSTRVTEYVWNGPRIAEEYVAGKLAARYVHGRGIDEIVRAEQSTKLDGTLDRTLYPLQDELGNVERLTDGAGATLERYEYEGYGLFTSYRPLASGGEGPATSATSAYGWRHLFQGREYSELSGSYDFRARTLWPDLGRFGQEDPAGVFDHGNLYQSVLGNWTMNSDPSGEVVVMMHGIKDDGAGWASGVAQAFGEQWDQTGADPGQDVINLVNQQWTGPQNVPGCNPGEFCLGNAYWSLMKGHLDRDTRRAGEKVALHMNQLRTILNASKTRIGEPIQVLAHSHGTSMLLAATQTSRKSHPITMTWFRIQKAVMVGSDMKYSTNIGALLSVADAVFNFYSPHDEAVGIAVAPGGGGRGFHEPRDFVRLKMLKAANLTQTELPGIRHTGDVFERQHGSIPWMSRQLAMRYYSGIFEIRARRKVGESQSWLGSYALLRGLMGLRQTMDLSPYFFLSYPSARP